MGWSWTDCSGKSKEGTKPENKYVQLSSVHISSVLLGEKIIYFFFIPCSHAFSDHEKLHLNIDCDCI